MRLGPIIRREQILLLRRGSPWTERSSLAVFMVLILVGWMIKTDWSGEDRQSIAGVAQFIWEVFELMIAVQLGLSGLFALSLTASAVAIKRDRRTLDELLVTELRSADIVLGLMAAALIRVGLAWLALGPVVVVLVWLGGIDPRLVALAGVGLGSMTLMLAAVGIVCSVECRTASRAGGWAIPWLYLWIGLPPLVLVLLPRVWASAATWLVPIADPILASSPVGVALSHVGLIPRGPLAATVPRMIAWQLLVAAILTGWAIVRLRPASRAVAGWTGWTEWRRTRQRQGRVRPPCGNDPILWREMYPARPTGPVLTLVLRGIALLVVGLMVYVTSWFAGPAGAELWAAGGYGPSAGPTVVPEIHPVARVMLSHLTRLTLTNPAPGQARLDFNAYLRLVTLGFEMIILITLVGCAAESVAAERDRDTWPGLLVTPLSGRAILRGKCLGSIWKINVLTIPLVIYWLVGTLLGAVHPVGLLVAAVELGVSTWFLASAGVALSLLAPDRQKAVAWTLLPIMGVVVLSILGFLQPGLLGVVPAAFLTPFQGWATLFSYDDVRALTRGEALPTLAMVRINSAAGTWLVLAIGAGSLSAQAVAAWLLTRTSARRFDALVGRPVRSRVDPPQVRTTYPGISKESAS